MLQPVLKKTTSGVLRGIFGESVVLPEWTPIYEGLTTFGELYSAWQPSGNDWEVEVEVYFPEKDGFNRVLLGTDLSITGSDNPDLTWDGNNGAIYVQDKSGAFFVLGNTSSGNYFNLKYASTLSVFDALAYKSIGVDVAKVAAMFNGQIHRIKLLDNYDTGRTEYPVNGRDVVPLDGLTQYGEIPAWSATNGVIEFDFVLSAPIGSVDYLVDARGQSGVGFFMYSRGSDGNLVFSGANSVTIDGAAITNTTFTPKQGCIYHVVIALSSSSPIKIGSNYLLADLLSGFTANLRLTDLDNPSNSRYYPLDRADIIQDVNGDGSTDGNWINNPPQVHRLNNSIDINTIKRSKEAPLASDNLLINSLGSVGDELVVNGDFEDGLNGWVVANSTASVANGVASIVAETGYPVIGQGIPTNVGDTVRIAFYGVSVPDGERCRVIIGQSLGSGSDYVGASFDGGEVAVTFTATASFHWVQLQGDNVPVGSVIEVSRLSVRETTRNIGEIKNLTGYQPVLKGGGLNRENVPDKFEAFNGEYTDGEDFVKGVRLSPLAFTAVGGGSWSNKIPVNSILVSSTAVVKALSDLLGYTNAIALQGTDEQIQKGFEYPNVFRVIKPTDTSGEYEHYNTGGSYPWIP